MKQFKCWGHSCFVFRFVRLEMSVRSRCGQLLIVLTLICGIGGHWMFLQSVAWFSMLVKTSRECSWSLAIEKTFDGKHPCRLCKVIQDGKKTEKKQTIVKVETKLDFWLMASGLMWDVKPPLAFPPGLTATLQPRYESPPTPPPRLATV